MGPFGAYVEFYLKQHSGIAQHQTILVAPVTTVPVKVYLLEIYAFSNTIAWKDYEAIQSDIFDHFIAIIPEFGLSLYQAPSEF